MQNGIFEKISDFFLEKKIKLRAKWVFLSPIKIASYHPTLKPFPVSHFFIYDSQTLATILSSLCRQKNHNRHQEKKTRSIFATIATTSTRSINENQSKNDYRSCHMFDSPLSFGKISTRSMLESPLSFGCTNLLTKRGAHVYIHSFYPSKC